MNRNNLIIVLLLVFVIIFSSSIYSELKKGNQLSDNKYGFMAMKSSEDKDSYIRSEMDICYKNGLDDCYKQVASVFMGQFSYSVILDSFQRNEQYPEIFSRCHETTHFIGRLAYDTDKSVPDLYSHGSSACWGGFYHGVIEGYFGAMNINPNDPTDSKVTKEIIKVCGQRSDYVTPRFYGECLHGIGHAMMFVTQADLPASLAWCDKLSTESDRTTCYGGVFMENSSSSTSVDHPSKYIKNDDPFYPCDSLEERYLGTCYSYQSSYFARIVKYDWSENAKLCREIPASYQKGCFNIIGSNQVGNRADIKSMHNVCDLMPTQSSKEDCVSGVASGLGGRYVLDSSKMIDFCNTVDPKLAKSCWTSIGNSVRGWYQNIELAKNSCSMINPEETNWCLSGLSANSTDVFNK